MLITMLQAQSIRECLRHNIPFAIYVLPGSDVPQFMASLPDDKGESHPGIVTDGADCFFISRFASDEPYMAGINAVMDEAQVIEYIASHPDVMYDAPCERPYLTSTRRVSYDEAYRNMTRRLRKDGGKVVLSRHEALWSGADITDVADEYFRHSPTAFRYLCFTPETGVWLGATPELLLESATDSGQIRTMALAGSRPTGDGTGEWDNKNIQEHEVVVRFITDTLASHGLEVSAGPLGELQAGPVTHLYTPITARGDIHSVGQIINDLNPTPAVAGWPRQLAIAEIDAFETHQRRCYSGIVGVRTGGKLRVYVNLRCAFAAPARLDGHDGWVYNLYAGGGLMPDSVLDDEWEETGRKMSALSLCIPGATPSPLQASFI
ncbi:MAG: chorismate-binding protein [Duncaniella sp.]|nr:chorismate-binding protein [Duncaniella sp.]